MLPTVRPAPATCEPTVLASGTPATHLQKTGKRLRATVRLTAADQALITFLTRTGYATAPQAHRALRPQAREQATYARLKRLERVGLLRCVTHAIPSGTRAVYLPTRLGYRWIGSPLTPLTTVSLATFNHTLAVADQIAQHSSTTLEFLTDREIRHEITTDRAAATEPNRWLTHGRTHAPDLFFPTIRGRHGQVMSVAIEVELTAKTPAALRSVMAWYRHTPLVDRVHYVVGTTAVERAVRRAAHAESLAHKLTLEQYVPRHSPKTVQH